MNLLWVALGSFVLSFVFRYMMSRKETKSDDDDEQDDVTGQSFLHRWLADPKYRSILFGSLLVIAVIFPHVFSTYQTSIMTTALMYVVLGLGLNIVVGLAGLLAAERGWLRPEPEPSAREPVSVIDVVLDRDAEHVGRQRLRPDLGTVPGRRQLGEDQPVGQFGVGVRLDQPADADHLGLLPQPVLRRGNLEGADHRHGRPGR